MITHNSVGAVPIQSPGGARERGKGGSEDGAGHRSYHFVCIQKGGMGCVDHVLVQLVGVGHVLVQLVGVVTVGAIELRAAGACSRPVRLRGHRHAYALSQKVCRQMTAELQNFHARGSHASTNHFRRRGRDGTPLRSCPGACRWPVALAWTRMIRQSRSADFQPTSK